MSLFYFNWGKRHKLSQNKMFAYFKESENPFDISPENLYGKELFGTCNISLGTAFEGVNSLGGISVKLKLNSTIIH